jgi:hypothetical protein
VVNIPINLVDDANNALQYDFDPGFNLAGQSVTYHAADGQAIGSLVNNTTYTIKPLSGVSNEFQLFDTQNSTLVPIITDPTFDGLARNLSATLNEANNTLSFNFNPGFTDTSLIVYQGATGAGAANLSNLQVGQAYWVLPDDSDASGETFQLASSPDGTPIAIGGGGSDTGSLNFQLPTIPVLPTALRSPTTVPWVTPIQGCRTAPPTMPSPIRTTRRYCAWRPARPTHRRPTRRAHRPTPMPTTPCTIVS